jgi:hypothetical protein
MTQAALLYQDDLGNQGGIGLSHPARAISAKAQEVQPALSWVKQLMAGIPTELFLSGVETSLRASLAGGMSALTLIERLVGFPSSIARHEEDLASENIPLFFPSSKDEISAGAEEYARPLGIYGSLLRSQEIVWCVIPELKKLRIDRYDDREEGGYSVIRLEIVTSKAAREIAQLDDQLQDIFCREIPPRHQPYFAFTYQFEK